METRRKSRLHKWEEPVVRGKVEKRRLPTPGTSHQRREERSSTTAHIPIFSPPTSSISSSTPDMTHPAATTARRPIVLISLRPQRPGSPNVTTSRPDRSIDMQLGPVPTLPTAQSRSQGNEEMQKQAPTRSRKGYTVLEQEQLQHEETKKLLEARTAELQSLQAFLGPISSTVTEAEVRAMVEDLNNEIVQASAAISDSLDPRARHSTLPRYYPIQAKFIAGNMLDEYILDKLWNAYQDVGFRAQVALQACMTAICVHIINYLSHRNVKVVETLAEQVAQSVSFPVYAKWRAITHQQTVQPAEWSRFWLSQLTARAKDTLYIAGFVKMPNKLQERLGRVVDMATALNITTKQQMLSSDAEAFSFIPGERFNPATMQCDYSPPKNQTPSPAPQPREQILCTTGIGLRFTDARTVETAVALKAMVAMRDIFEDESDLV
ncbi:hypothetical protein BDN72DRAFT_306447 [Pluteus cervinus]|uniref:Uncharacterized protein n=1 Tax=Pluteus cervinus TaxID=181527 RepID=A0ACD3ADC2_9AGAR|nr:hypothetical protein BDN72DRAFT_306447 [Pluteus cervinus]